MKILSILFLSALCACGQSTFRNVAFVGSLTTSGGGCPEFASITNASFANFIGVCESAGRVFVGQRDVTNTVDWIVCGVDVFAYDVVGDISGKDYYVYVYTQSGNNLASVVGTSTKMDGNNSWDGTIHFSFSAPVTLTANTKYSLVVACVSDGAGASAAKSVDGSNYLRLRISGADLLPGAAENWAEAGGYQAGTATEDFCMGVYLQ